MFLKYKESVFMCWYYCCIGKGETIMTKNKIKNVIYNKVFQVKMNGKKVKVRLKEDKIVLIL